MEPETETGTAEQARAMEQANEAMQAHFREHRCNPETCGPAQSLYRAYLRADAAFYGIDTDQVPTLRRWAKDNGAAP